MLPFNTLFFFFAKIPFRPCIVLSRVKFSRKSVVSVPERLAGSLSDR